MNRALLAGVAALAFSSPALAEGISVDTSLAFESRYVFRGIQFAETSFQPGIELGKDGFYVGAWANLPVGDDDGIFGTAGEELDLYGGYSTTIAEGVDLDLGITYYTFPALASGFGDLFDEDDGTGTNTLEAYLGFSFDVPLAPSFYVYRDFNFETVTLEGSAGYSFPVAEKTSFDVGAAAGYVLDDDAGADYFYGSVSADFVYAASDSAAVTAGVRYGGSETSALVDDSIAGTTKDTGFWYGLSVSTSF